MNVADDVIPRGHALLLRLFKLLSSVCRMIWLFSFSARSYVDERSYATPVSKSDIEGQESVPTATPVLYPSRWCLNGFSNFRSNESA
jgi:hypothetical protein